MARLTTLTPPSAEQWMVTILGARNPMNSWSKSDSKLEDGKFILGAKDKELAIKLVKAGEGHRKFLRMLPIIFEAELPMYVLKELDTYKIGTSCNSCSTMHKLGERALTLNDFELDVESFISHRVHLDFGHFLEDYNHLMDMWKKAEDEEEKKSYWRLLVQWLPMSYKQKRTYCINYEVALKLLAERKHHKLKEWNEVCDELLEQLPYLRDFYNAYIERRKSLAN